MNLVIIDYGSGNLRSASKALERVKNPNSKVYVTKDPEIVAKADYLILPGVGAFPDCKRGITTLPGMIDAIKENVLSRGRPFLGICVGMQLMATVGYEHGETEGFGWLPGEVKRIDTNLKIPHMGWNEVNIVSDHPVLSGVPNNSHFYFVHSYFAQPTDKDMIAATTIYGIEFCSAVAYENVVAVQFHPEKSGTTGLKIYENFVQFTKMSMDDLP